MSDTLVSVEEYARRTGVNVKTLYSAARRGELAHVRAGRRLLLYAPESGAGAGGAAAPKLSALRQARVEVLLELLGRQAGQRLVLDANGYATAATAGLSASAVDQAVDDLRERVRVTRDGAIITVSLAAGQVVQPTVRGPSE